MVNVGVVLPNPLPAGTALPDVAGLARLAETVGLDGIWTEDGVGKGTAAVLDIMCVLAAAAGATEQIEIGSAIFIPSVRDLFWALKQVATLQLVSGGRLRLGVALGAVDEEEYRLAGQARSGQARRTDEFLGLLASARRGELAPLPSRALLLGTAVPVPPVWVGGTSPAAIRRAARFGDGWLSALQPLAEFKASSRQMHELAEKAGRPNPLAGVVLNVAVGVSPSDNLVLRSAVGMQDLYGIPAPQAEAVAIGGTPEQVAGQIAPYIEAGVSQVCLVSHVLPYSESWPLLAEVRRALVGR